MMLTFDYPELSPTEIANDDALRSNVMKHLLVEDLASAPEGIDTHAPRVIFQFWDDLHAIPTDVQRCMASWSRLEQSGFARKIFDGSTASDFITENFDDRHLSAYEKCAHPAMKADYFRLCILFKLGGFYVDADDTYLGEPLDTWFEDDRLQIQPLCYEMTSDSMVDPVAAAQASREDDHIFYVNNNPLIAPPMHPIVGRALERATTQLMANGGSGKDLQSLTGPGNLTAAVVESAIVSRRTGQPPEFKILANWDSFAISDWSLEYRSDQRNWRNWVRTPGPATYTAPDTELGRK